jgi:hypothetical protein
MFMSAAAVYLISGLLWLKIDATKPVIPASSETMSTK